jgi:L-lactate utilization protein LutB
MIKILSLATPDETSRLLEIISDDMPAGTRMSSTRNAREARRKLNEKYYDVVVLSGYYSESEELIAKGKEKGSDVIVLDGYTSGMRETAEKSGARVFSAPEMAGLREYLLGIVKAKQEEYAKKPARQTSRSSETPLCPAREE